MTAMHQRRNRLACRQQRELIKLFVAGPRTVRAAVELVGVQAARWLHLEGLGFWAIGRLLGYSHVSIMKWMGAVPADHPISRLPESSEGIELDEMSPAQGKKAKRRIWVAVDRLTKQVIALVTGQQGRSTERLLWSQIRHIPS